MGKVTNQVNSAKRQVRARVHRIRKRVSKLRARLNAKHKKAKGKLLTKHVAHIMRITDQHLGNIDKFHRKGKLRVITDEEVRTGVLKEVKEHKKKVEQKKPPPIPAEAFKKPRKPPPIPAAAKRKRKGVSLMDAIRSKPKLKKGKERKSQKPKKKDYRQQLKERLEQGFKLRGKDKQKPLAKKKQEKLTGQRAVLAELQKKITRVPGKGRFRYSA